MLYYSQAARWKCHRKDSGLFRNGGRRGDVTQAAKHGNRSERRNHALNKASPRFASLCACLICIPLIHVSHRIAPLTRLEQSDTASTLKTKGNQTIARTPYVRESRGLATAQQQNPCNTFPTAQSPDITKGKTCEKRDYSRKCNRISHASATKQHACEYATACVATKPTTRPLRESQYL